MSTAILDARGWQNSIDLETGMKTEASGPLAEMVGAILHRHPYPGDTDPQSNRWVSDTALELIKGYEPRFVFLTYASQYFSGRYTLMPKEMRARMIAEAFREAERFVEKSGFDAFLVGTGDMTPVLGFIDLTGLDGLAICSHWSTGYAGLYGATSKDMRLLEEEPHIEKIASREEVLTLFGGTCDHGPRLPEYLMRAGRGYAFKTVTDTARSLVMIPSLNFDIPLYAPGRAIEEIVGIRQALEEDLQERKVALIVMEGVGLDEFPWPHAACRNGLGWYYYEPGEAQYLTIVSGTHCFLDYPTGSGQKYLDGEEATGNYPFSGHFKSIPQGPFARTFPGRSIAVGNKSMFMHMVTGADVSIECFARNLYNQGTMAVIHRGDKS